MTNEKLQTQKNRDEIVATELERKFKVKQQIAEINNTDFLEMTFDMYVKKYLL